MTKRFHKSTTTYQNFDKISQTVYTSYRRCSFYKNGKASNIFFIP